MGLSVYIGTQMVPSPGDLDGYEQRLVRDLELRMIYLEAPGTLTFAGGAYRILREAFLADFCSSVTLRVFDDCSGVSILVCSGEIILSDVRWQISRCTAEAPVQMGSVGARILDNMALVLSPTATTSKNGVTIAPVPTFNLSVDDPQSAAATSRAARPWDACLRHAIDFLTDGTTQVFNDWYAELPDDQGLCIVQGYHWRTQLGTIDPLSYDLRSLWLEVARRFNLWMVVQQGPTGITSVRVLSDDATYAPSSPLSISKIDAIEQEIDADTLFGSVVVGEERERNRAGLAYSALLYYQSLTHVQEQYGVTCLCNRGSELDLRCELVADHGTLERVMWRDSTDTVIDETPCLVQYVRSTLTAAVSEYTQSGYPLYNEQMLNYRVLGRYPSLCGVLAYQPPAADVLARNDATVLEDLAYATGLTVPWSVQGDLIVGPLNADPPSPLTLGLFKSFPIDAPPGGSDPDDLWTGGDRYTASTTGMRSIDWQFRMSVRVDMGGSLIDGRRYWRATIRIRLFDASNVLLSTVEIPSEVYASGTFATLQGSTSIFMQTGHYLDIRFIPEIVLPSDFLTVNTLTFRLSLAPPRIVAITTQNLATAEGDPSARRVILSKFERHLPPATWAAMLADPRTPILIDGAGMPSTIAWVKELSRDVLRGTARFTLMHRI